MTLTIYFAQFFGLLFLILALSMLFGKKMILEALEDFAHNKGLSYLGGLIAVAAGLAMVLGHNIWNAGMLALVVTLIGWLMLVKGIMLLFVTPELYMKIYKMFDLGNSYYIISIIFLLVSLYFMYAGFA